MNKIIAINSYPYTFLNRTLVAQTLSSTMTKWDLMKLKSFVRHCKYDKMPGYTLGKYLPQPHIGRRIDIKISNELKKLKVTY